MKRIYKGMTIPWLKTYQFKKGVHVHPTTEFKKGSDGVWLGKKRPELNKTNAVKTMFKKGQIPWNKGKVTLSRCIVCGSEYRTTKSNLAKGIDKCSLKCRLKYNESLVKYCLDCGVEIHPMAIRCRSCANKGEFSPFYIHGLWRINAKERDIIKATAEYKKWRKMIFERDEYTCRMCGLEGGMLHADHIKSFLSYPKLRLNVDNGRTLCVQCHKKTPNYGRRAIIERREVMSL